MNTTRTNRVTPESNRFRGIDRRQELEAALERFRIKPCPVAIGAAEDCNLKLEPVETWTHELTREEITRQLLSQLPFLAKRRPWRRRQIHLGYDRAIEQIQIWRTETREFLRQIPKSAVKFSDFNDDTRTEEKARQAMADLLSEFCEFQFGRMTTARSLERSAQRDKDIIYYSYAENLRAVITGFVDQLLLQLERMSERGLIGTATYAGVGRDLHCQFTAFYSHAIRQVTTEDRKKLGTTYEYRETPTKWFRHRRTTFRLLAKGTVLIRHVHGAYLLGEVKVKPLRRWRRRVPERIATLLGSVPSFLKPHCRVIDGDQREGLELAKDVDQMPFEYSRDELDEEVTRHYDPILTLGPFVCGHWCEQERTLSRREWSRRRKELVS